jgi:homoserine O-acetyltransferase
MYILAADMADKKDNSAYIVQTQTIRLVEADKPLELACGKTLGPIDVAYETYGQLNKASDNTVLICHALSGDAHVAGKKSPDDKRRGWWDSMVGPGKWIDTDKYFVICSNFLGGCSGTTGPSSKNPETGKPYGLDFPIITIADMVKVQKLLLDKLGIKQLLCVVGGSIGGMQVLQWTIDYPEFIRSAIPIATTSHLGAQSIAFDAVGRNAILADSAFSDGQYHNGKGPDKGLSIARMIGHITYLSEVGMRNKFGRQLREAQEYSYDLGSEFAVETYLDYQGASFVERFDANSYLYITKAADYFDLDLTYGGLERAFAKTKSRFLIVSFSSDWLFTPGQSEEIVNALVANRKDVSYVSIESSYGHDAFLLENNTLGRLISCFLEATYRPDATRKCSPDDEQQSTNLGRRTRIDYELIESLIEPNSSVLDVGCGDGELLARLKADKNIRGEGIELEHDSVLDCVCRTIPVIQYDIERGLAAYEDKSFDAAILSQTLQTLNDPKKVFLEMLRVGKKVIASFPNFAHWRCRLQLLTKGKAPVTRELPFGWHDSPNIHFLSLKDFERFCKELGVTIEKRIPLVENKPRAVRLAPNLFAEQAIYVTSKP